VFIPLNPTHRLPSSGRVDPQGLGSSPQDVRQQVYPRNRLREGLRVRTSPYFSPHTDSLLQRTRECPSWTQGARSEGDLGKGSLSCQWSFFCSVIRLAFSLGLLRASVVRSVVVGQHSKGSTSWLPRRKRRSETAPFVLERLMMRDRELGDSALPLEERTAADALSLHYHTSRCDPSFCSPLSPSPPRCYTDERLSQSASLGPRSTPSPRPPRPTPPTRRRTTPDSRSSLLRSWYPRARTTSLRR
jgi:hypothetical protein